MNDINIFLLSESIIDVTFWLHVSVRMIKIQVLCDIWDLGSHDISLFPVSIRNIKLVSQRM